MAKTVNIKLSSSTGSSTGPTFDLFSDANSYASAFESGVSKTTLMGVGGYTSTVVPDAATIIRVKSTGTCTTYDDYTLASQTPTPTPTAVSQTPTPTPTAVSQTPTPTPTAVAQTPTPTPTTASGQCYVYLVQSTVTQSSYGVRYTPPGQGSRDERFNMMLALDGGSYTIFNICSTVEPTLLDYTQGAPTGIGQVDGITRTGPNGSCSSSLDCSGASQTPTPTAVAGQTPTPTPTAVAQTPTPTPTPTGAPITYTYDCDEVDGCYAVEGTGGTYSNLSACQDDCIISPPPCFIEGTSITMSDGTTKLIEELVVGDTLMSFNIEGLPLDSDTNEVLSTWNTNEIVGNLSQTTIVNIVAKPSDKTILINNLLRTTEYHRHLIKRSSGWSFIQAKDVLAGQFLLDINNNEIEVTSVDTIEETVTIYKMDVESLDVFYAENILTHNLKNPDTYWCKTGAYGACEEQASPCGYNQTSCTQYEQPVGA